jgi:phage repressor protein C with HTH and peptisase S24 domain
MDSKEKINELMKALGLDQQEFARRLGVSPQQVTNYKSRSISRGAIRNIEKAFPNVNPNWLLGTETNMFRDSNKKENPYFIETKEGQIPLIPINAIGVALSYADYSYKNYDVSWYKIPSFRKSDFMIRVEGDSMEPKFLRGDIVACNQIPLTDLWFQWGKVYLVNTIQGALIKHIEKGSDDDHILLVSDNPSYKPFEISKKELKGVAIVNGLIREE